ncbi:right-handed parallel beta-helix repeat-containing protein [Natronomonas marina]|jgi:hypothetical protein|uniref:right-handed parallel beta-helix repeat-containing protein n=1 Tax=Natronomonas marina TaxID=2961939 RepID=UPI0020C9CFAF|nr:right-handed parallel beta-helix repeat-containing protein [Natronomonas marina]
MNTDRRTLLKAGAAVGAAGVVGASANRDVNAHVARSESWGEQTAPEPYDDYDVHRVAGDGSGDFETIQAAVNGATPRDLILVSPGRYTEEVEINDTPYLTIRGTDREEVVIDGENERYNGIRTTADGTVVENLTVKDHRGNGVYWTNSVTGYRGSYVTAIRNGVYGIYAFSSEKGRFEHCYTSGCKDAGFYIGETQQADAVITDCLAEQNAMGYSGTNSGGNLVIRDSIWRDNAVGIVPNTLDSQEGAPQGHENGGIRIENNEIYDNNNLEVPMYSNAYAVSGAGVVVAGGVGNDICDNTIENHDKYGIGVIPMVTGDTNLYRPRNNAVMRNRVRGSTRADLALSAPAAGNAFSDNEVGSTRPTFLQRRDGSFGDVWVFLNVLKDFMQADEIGSYPQGTDATVEDPDPETLRSDLDEYELADPETEPPKPPIGGLEDV